MTATTIDQQIERLIDQAMATKVARFNRHGVGAFEVCAGDLPEGITFDRLGLYDASILSGNGQAQVRNRKRGPISITFCTYAEIATEV